MERTKQLPSGFTRTLEEQWKEAERNLNYWLERLDHAKDAAEQAMLSNEATKWDTIAASRFDALMDIQRAA